MLPKGVLTILTVLSLSSGDYVRRGSDISDCSLQCPRTDGVLELYRQCGGEDTRLLELWCENMWYRTPSEPRLHLNPDSGCWTLTDAEKDDSCVYNVVYDSDGGRTVKMLHITVLDPVLISNITSNCSRLGQDIAVSVQFSGEETAVTWEVDGGPLPDRYRLIDDRKTLIIPSAQRDDDGRRLRVRITNPISEETREYQLKITGVLTILTILSLSSGDYVQKGSDISDCSLQCPRTDGVLELYRQCGGEDTRLLELWCENMWYRTPSEPRLHLNPDSGCWTLTDAEKDDSCVYNVVYDSDGGRTVKTLHITVLDPVLISNITSNSSRLGQDIAVSVQFSGEETAVTWEVDGGPLPDRYRLMDDRKTLIILSAQRDDDGRRLRVRITNPISEETREYQLKITDPRSLRYLSFLASGQVVLMILLAGIFLVLMMLTQNLILIVRRSHMMNGSGTSVV